MRRQIIDEIRYQGSLVLPQHLVGGHPATEEPLHFEKLRFFRNIKLNEISPKSYHENESQRNEVIKQKDQGSKLLSFLTHQ